MTPPPPGGLKGVKMNFREKSENVMFLHSLRLSYMQKNRKFYRAVFQENRVREGDRERETETDPNSRVLRMLSLSRQTKHTKLNFIYSHFSFHSKILFSSTLFSLPDSIAQVAIHFKPCSYNCCSNWYLFHLDQSVNIGMA